MKRFSAVLLLLIPILSVGGCAICCSPLDDHYPAYGGLWERDVANQYRVGSAFEDAGHRIDSEMAEEGDQPPPAVPEGEDN